MTELEQLRQRRELVVLAAELQRATVVRRLERIQANPARRILALAAGALRRPAMPPHATREMIQKRWRTVSKVCCMS